LKIANATRNPSHQPNGALRVSTIELILSVTDPNVCPGAITGGTPVPTTAAFGSSIGARLSAMIQFVATEPRRTQREFATEPRRTQRKLATEPRRHGDRFGKDQMVLGVPASLWPIVFLCVLCGSVANVTAPALDSHSARP